MKKIIKLQLVLLFCVLLLKNMADRKWWINFGFVMVGSFHLTSQLSDFDIFDQTLARVKYDKRVRPGSEHGNQTTVKINMHINDISSVDEMHMEFSIDVYLRQMWIDKRLSLVPLNTTHTLHLYHDVLERIWRPDLFISNSKGGNLHDINVPNRLLRIHPDGTILYSERMTLRVACSLSLGKYPLDNQTCKLQIESYGHLKQHLEFEWVGSGSDAIQRDNDISLPEYYISHMGVGDCTMFYITGTYTCIYAQLEFQRTIGYYLIQTYIPSILVVFLSWVSFWIDMHAVPARITLGLLTVLTMTTQASAITQTLPRVSYIKAIDVWMATCLTFVVGALVEYSVVNVLARDVQTKLLKKMTFKRNQSMSQASLSWLTNGEMPHNLLQIATQRNLANGLPIGNESESDLDAGGGKGSDYGEDDGGEGQCCKNRLWRKDKALFVDKFSRVAFPLSFIIFNTIYWVVYMLIM